MKQLLTKLGRFLLSLDSNEEVTPDQLVGRLGITYKINSTTPFTGSSVDYHDNGQMSSGGKYKDGKRYGIFESFDKDGERDGPYERFDENGNRIWTRTYRNGVEVE
jgi:antitoxin component YwqK of YwqJK toxin-antitoxin module